MGRCVSRPTTTSFVSIKHCTQPLPMARSSRISLGEMVRHGGSDRSVGSLIAKRPGSSQSCASENRGGFLLLARQLAWTGRAENPSLELPPAASPFRAAKVNALRMLSSLATARSAPLVTRSRTKMRRPTSPSSLRCLGRIVSAARWVICKLEGCFMARAEFVSLN
jgi:hypothetical protein